MHSRSSRLFCQSLNIVTSRTQSQAVSATSIAEKELTISAVVVVAVVVRLSSSSSSIGSKCVSGAQSIHLMYRLNRPPNPPRGLTRSAAQQTVLTSGFVFCCCPVRWSLRWPL